MTGRLEGKVCVITGAASGIGAETARLFARGGRDGRRRRPRRRAPRATSRSQADVTDEEQVERHVRARARASSGASTCSSTTPGINPTDDASVLDTSLEAWQRVQDVNLRSVFLCCKHGIPHLLEAGGGSVINTASFVAVMGAAISQISYTASKGGVLALSRELGVEFARRGVRVNALCPGPVDTPLLQELFAKRPGEGGAPARARADGPLRRGAARSPARRCSWRATSRSYVTATSLHGRRRAIAAPTSRPSSDRVEEAARTERAARARSRPRSWARSRRAARPGRARCGSRPGRCGSRRSSAAASARETSAWNWIPQARSPSRNACRQTGCGRASTAPGGSANS